MPRLTQPHPGFTFIELSVVIGLFVLLSLIALPYLHSSNQHAKLTGDAQALVSDLDLARQRTIGEQVTYLIKLFNTNPPKYQLLQRNGTDTLIKERVLSTGISWQSLGGFTNNEIIFNTIGAVNQYGSVTLVSQDNQVATVDIKPSGYVRTY